MEQARIRTSEDFANPQQSQKRKRRRDHVSCQPCRVRKVACDRQRPCMTCISRKCADDCVYGEPSDTSASLGQGSNVNETDSARVLDGSAEERLARLEDRFRVLVENRTKSYSQIQVAEQRSNAGAVRFSHQDDYKRPTFVDRNGNDTTFCLAQHSWSFPSSQDVRRLAQALYCCQLRLIAFR